MGDLLQLSDLQLCYGSQNVACPINATFRRGWINLIVGRTGTGKSTLLRTIAGFHDDFSGKIELDGSKLKSEGNIALAFQNPENLFFNPSVGEEICYALNQKGLEKKKAEELGKTWLDRWGLDPEKFWFKHPLELSGGEKRKVALSACTVLLPEIILLDEPLAGIDFCGQVRLLEILDELAKEHIVIIVTHDPEMLLASSSRVLFLAEDKVEQLSVNEFVRKALENTWYYPLPEWYSQALKRHVSEARFPKVNARSVYKFIKGMAGNGDYLFSG
ncbi:MAG: hypothetical protein Kow0029_12220 [Candidatus Rifleibacteriota bacterium]